MSEPRWTVWSRDMATPGIWQKEAEHTEERCRQLAKQLFSKSVDTLVLPPGEKPIGFEHEKPTSQ